MIGENNGMLFNFICINKFNFNNTFYRFGGHTMKEIFLDGIQMGFSEVQNKTHCYEIFTHVPKDELFELYYLLNKLRADIKYKKNKYKITIEVIKDEQDL